MAQIAQTLPKTARFAALTPLGMTPCKLAPIVTLFGLFAAHEFHQFGLCLAPILVRIVIGSVARLVDLVSSDSYLFFWKGAH